MTSRGLKSRLDNSRGNNQAQSIITCGTYAETTEVTNFQISKGEYLTIDRIQINKLLTLVNTDSKLEQIVYRYECEGKNYVSCVKATHINCFPPPVH